MRILFLGRKSHGAAALRWLCQSGHDVVGVITDSHIQGSPTTTAAIDLGLDVMSLEDATRRLAEGEIEIDLAVSYVFWRLIKEPLISIPKFGVINFHPAPLPDLKGTAGYNVAILEKREAFAVSAHYVDATIDTGEIIEVFEFPIDPEGETAVTLENLSQQFLLRLFKKTVRRVAREGRLQTIPNSGGRSISRDEMESMKRINDGDDVAAKVRAFWFPPYRGAFIEIDGVNYTLVDDALLRTLAPSGETFQL